MFQFLRRWSPAPLTSIDHQILSLLQSRATLFGSRAWNVATSKSDYDYYTDHFTLEYLRVTLNTNTYSVTNLYGYRHKLDFRDGISFYLSNGQKIQVMCYSLIDKRHPQFLNAITVMTTLSQHLDIQAKPYRYHLFEQVFRLVRQTQHTLTKHEYFLVQQHHSELFI